MPNKDVCFLNACGVIRGDNKSMVNEVFELTAVSSEEADRHDTFRFGGHDSFDDIGALA